MALVLYFTIFFLAPTTIKARWCENGGTGLSNGYCRCASGYDGNSCEYIKCVHGTRRTTYTKCVCNDGWAGKFCNVTKESICVHGKVMLNEICWCDDNWTGDKCDERFCVAFSERVSKTECKCTYSGVYPDCEYEVTDTLTPILVGTAIVCILIICGPVVYYCYIHKKNEERASEFASRHQTNGENVVILPPPVRFDAYPPASPLLTEEPPPSYSEVVGKQYY